MITPRRVLLAALPAGLFLWFQASGHSEEWVLLAVIGIAAIGAAFFWRRAGLVAMVAGSGILVWAALELALRPAMPLMPADANWYYSRAALPDWQPAGLVFLDRPPFVRRAPLSSVYEVETDAIDQRFDSEWQTGADGFKPTTEGKGPKVIVLGGDAAEGIGLAPELTWPSRLSGIGYDVTNAGTAGFGLRRATAMGTYLIEQGARPETILIAYEANDAFRDPAVLSPRPLEPWELGAQLSAQIEGYAAERLPFTVDLATVALLRGLRKGRMEKLERPVPGDGQSQSDNEPILRVVPPYKPLVPITEATQNLALAAYLNAHRKEVRRAVAGNLSASGLQQTEEWKQSLEALDDLAATARENSIDVHLVFIPPRGRILAALAPGVEQPLAGNAAVERLALRDHANAIGIGFLDLAAQPGFEDRMIVASRGSWRDLPWFIHNPAFSPTGAGFVASAIAAHLGASDSGENQIAEKPVYEEALVEILQSTYGANCGGQEGNAFDDLFAACSGKGICDYNILYTRIGDPKVGCAKDYRALWRCDLDDIVREKYLPAGTGVETQIRFDCSETARAGAGIRVESATYGAICGVERGNLTDFVKSVCEGSETCDFVVDVNRFGDPAPGCGKDFTTTWSCGGSFERQAITLPAEAGLGSMASLSCQGHGSN